MPELEHVIEEVKRFLKDVEAFLSITLKNEKLKKDTNSRREALLREVAGINLKLSPPQIEEEEEEQDEYTDVKLPPSPDADRRARQEVEEEDCDAIYDDTVPESTHSNDSSQQSDEHEEGEEQEDKSGMFDLDGDPYGGVNPIAASDLMSPSKEGFLDKKRKEGQFGLSWQKRYCIIKGNVLYYYKKKTDKEQCNQIVLTGYQGREAPDIERKNRRKDLLFEVVCPTKRSYQFIAQNKQDMHEWIKAIAGASKLGPSLIDPLAKSTPNNSGGSEEMLEDYDDTSIPCTTGGEDDDEYGETYEELDAYQATKMGGLPETPTIPVSAQPPAVTVAGGQDDDEAEPIDEEIYEDVSQANEPPPPLPAMPERKVPAANKPLPPEPPASNGPPPPVPTTHRPVPPPAIPSPTSLDRPSPRPYSPRMPVKTYQGKAPKGGSVASKPSLITPGPPVPGRAGQEGLPTALLGLPRKEPWEEDYANIYVGLWDCSADDKDELEFRRGEMVHIISKEYDTFSWWIGEKNNKVGLVPKDYLMKAYMI